MKQAKCCISPPHLCVIWDLVLQGVMLLGAPCVVVLLRRGHLLPQQWCVIRSPHVVGAALLTQDEQLASK